MFLIDASLQFHANMHILLSSETKYGCNPRTANLHMLTGKQMENIKGQKCKKRKKWQWRCTITLTHEGSVSTCLFTTRESIKRQ